MKAQCEFLAYLDDNHALHQPDTEAFLWVKRAADAGLVKAMYATGYFYETGVGTEQSLAECVFFDIGHALIAYHTGAALVPLYITKRQPKKATSALCNDCGAMLIPNKAARLAC